MNWQQACEHASLLNISFALDPTEIRTWCKEHLGRHEWPRRVIVRATLPKNATVKILKIELRRTG